MARLISRILLVEVNLHISTDMALSSFMQHTGVLGFHFGLLSFQYVISPYPKGLQNYFQQPFPFMCHYSSILLVYTWQNTGIRFPTINTQAKWHSVHMCNTRQGTVCHKVQQMWFMTYVHDQDYKLQTA
jgi:hypothetical protein